MAEAAEAETSGEAAEEETSGGAAEAEAPLHALRLRQRPKARVKQRQNEERRSTHSVCSNDCGLLDVVVCFLHSTQTRIYNDSSDADHTLITSSVGAHSRPDQHG